jgi:hypothetical protein
MDGKFNINNTYYTGEVYEWNLPTGVYCPFANECKVLFNRVTQKFIARRGQYKSYASLAERVRNRRWDNFDFVSKGGKPKIPKQCKALRIHGSGDFFSQAYFDLWLTIARENPYIEMWAFTKSIPYWINRLNEIPNNLILTASYGGKEDRLIAQHNLKNVIVYSAITEVPIERPIDNNDDYARIPDINFALLDNIKMSKKRYLYFENE